MKFTFVNDADLYICNPLAGMASVRERTIVSNIDLLKNLPKSKTHLPEAIQLYLFNNWWIPILLNVYAAIEIEKDN